MNKAKYKSNQLRRRKYRVRKKISGDAQCPRLSVYRSLRHIYAQLIDDEHGCTLISASTLSEKYGSELASTGNIDAAAKVGESLARKALDMGIHRVRFDRNGCRYHGRIKALAESARKAGIAF